MGDRATNALLISTLHSILGILHAVSNKLPITATKAPAIAINGCLVLVVIELEDTGSSAGSIMSSNVEVVELMGGVEMFDSTSFFCWMISSLSVAGVKVVSFASVVASGSCAREK